MIHSIKRLAILFLLLMLFSACSNRLETDMHQASTDVNQTSYLNSKGYNIIESKGIIDSYTLKRSILLVMPYSSYWGLQNIKTDQYIGKEIKVFLYIVDNHPLDNLGDLNQTKVWLIICDNKIVGGYSLPNSINDLYGIGYSLDGHTLEEVTGLSYQKWNEEWMSKYQ